MGRLERKIKKQMNEDAEDFDAWYAKNETQFHAFSKENKESERSHGKGVAAISKRVLYPVIACIGCVVICLAVLLAVLLTNGKNDFAPTLNNGSNDSDLTLNDGKEDSDSTFGGGGAASDDFNFGNGAADSDSILGDEIVYTVAISEDELQKIKQTYPFIDKMQITSQNALLLREDNSLAFFMINGELETENDYYFLKVQIEYNNQYEFGDKSFYHELTNETIIDEWNVTYGQGLNDVNDLTVYYFLLQDNDGQKIYLEVHCSENDVEYILNEYLAR